VPGGLGLVLDPGHEPADRGPILIADMAYLKLTKHNNAGAVRSWSTSVTRSPPAASITARSPRIFVKGHEEVPTDGHD
jgi:hypothetical protein